MPAPTPARTAAKPAPVEIWTRRTGTPPVEQPIADDEGGRTTVTSAPYYHRDLEPYELSRREALLIVVVAVLAVIVVSAVLGTAGVFAYRRFFA